MDFHEDFQNFQVVDIQGEEDSSFDGSQILSMIKHNYPMADEASVQQLLVFFEENQQLIRFLHLVEKIEQQFIIAPIVTLPAVEIIDWEYEQILEYFGNTFQSQTQIDIDTLNKSSHLKVKKFKDKLYYGEMINSYRHGIGIIMGKDGSYYEGLWQNNIKQGRGFERLRSGGLYYGQYLNGHPEGDGVFRWVSNDLYIGEWMNGKKHNIGKWTTQSGDCYLGNWIEGNIEGYGFHVWQNGEIYLGEAKTNLKHGRGKEIFANQDIYEGEYTNGKPNGQGRYVWSNGTEYKGSFTNGLRNGIGIWLKRRVEGVDIYEGMYANDRKCGKGFYKWANGTVYEGQLYDDKRNGYGEINWIDGAYYKGDWQNGLMNGYGEFGNESQVFRGIWKDNVLIQSDDPTMNLIAMISLSQFPHMHTLKTVQNTIEQEQRIQMYQRSIEDEGGDQDVTQFEKETTKVLPFQGMISMPKSKLMLNESLIHQDSTNTNENTQSQRSQSLHFGQSKRQFSGLHENIESSQEKRNVSLNRVRLSKHLNQIQGLSQVSQSETENKEVKSRIRQTNHDKEQVSNSFDQKRFFNNFDEKREQYPASSNSDKRQSMPHYHIENLSTKKNRKELTQRLNDESLNLPLYLSNKGVQTVWFIDANTQTTIDKDKQINLPLRVIPRQKLNQASTQRLVETKRRVDIYRNASENKHNNAKYYETGYQMGTYVKNLMKQRRMHPMTRYLTDQEIKIWIMKMKKLKVNPRRYDDIWNEFVIRRIRQHIYPPVWLPSGMIHNSK